jgi:steroid 5-alpha reductase family enzyme
LWQIAIADLTGTIIIFFFSMLFNNSSMYDPYWSVKPLVIATFFITRLSPEEIGIAEIVGLLLVALYALRLTVNFYQGWPNIKHEDWRYKNFRSNFPNFYWIISFFGIHFFPTVMVYLGCLPLYVIFKQPVAYPVLFSFGSIVLFSSILLAYLADQQLRRFRLNPENDGNTIRIGLWKRSRHPNYLGEILTWWGLFLMALGCGVEHWWTVIGAVTITLMFKFISIPMIEKYALKRRWDYEDYQKQVPMLIPFLKP